MVEAHETIKQEKNLKAGTFGIKEVNREGCKYNMKRVYLAGPYTIGDVAVNVRKMMEVANLLIDQGYAPFVPLYSHFQHMHKPKPSKVWMKLDFEWLLQCDCLLRLDGESPGADQEVKFALEHKIPVFYNTADLFRDCPAEGGSQYEAGNEHQVQS